MVRDKITSHEALEVILTFGVKAGLPFTVKAGASVHFSSPDSADSGYEDDVLNGLHPAHYNGVF